MSRKIWTAAVILMRIRKMIIIKRMMMIKDMIIGMFIITMKIMIKEISLGHIISLFFVANILQKVALTPLSLP